MTALLPCIALPCSPTALRCASRSPGPPPRGAGAAAARGAGARPRAGAAADAAAARVRCSRPATAAPAMPPPARAPRPPRPPARRSGARRASTSTSTRSTSRSWSRPSPTRPAGPSSSRDNVRGKISIIGPENGKVEVDADAVLRRVPRRARRQQLAVVPHGALLQDRGEGARPSRTPSPRASDPDEPYTTNEQMITQLFKIRYVGPRAAARRAAAAGQPERRHHPLPAGHADRQRHRLEHAPAGADHRAAGQPPALRRDAGASRSSTPPRRSWPTTIQKLFERQGATAPGSAPGAHRRPPGPASGRRSARRAAAAEVAQRRSGLGGPATLTTAHPRRAHQQAHRRRQPRGLSSASTRSDRRSTSRSAARDGSTSTTSRTPTPRTSRPRSSRWRRAPPTGRAHPAGGLRTSPAPAAARRGRGRRQRRRAVPGRGEDLRGQGDQLAGGGREPVRLPEPGPGHREARPAAPPGLRRGGDHGGGPRPQQPSSASASTRASP